MAVLVKKRSREQERVSTEEIVTLEGQEWSDQGECGPHSARKDPECPRDWGRLGPVRFFYKNTDGSLS